MASFGLTATSAEAKAAPSAASAGTLNAAPAPVAVQWRNRRNWGRNRVRVVTQTRLVRRGRAVWRETYQTRYLPNGMTQTRLISRVRVR
ncbi:MAG TPA: hypothetical protein VJ866_10400 [Pyrinomonadaceae bacterium]|nr:hypothetical protein [Pyrinomonadaceae bacterium]